MDLPDEGARQIRIHLAQRKRDADARLRRPGPPAAGFSGAEIEESVIAALFGAFSEGKPLATSHVEKALRETVPLSRTMETELNRLRSWAEGRARPASPKTAVASEEHRRKLEM